uniref:Protein kinase domain-containing protein n=1 Tax=Neogobius melanostomus TaxID=47308 RepID=A0A8C6UI77_9GOBI
HSYHGDPPCLHDYGFKFCKVLHNGCNSKVFDCILKNHKERVAVKIPNEPQDNSGEANILKQLTSSTDVRYIANCYGKFTTDDNRTGLVFERLDITLAKYISLNRKPMSFKDTKYIIQQLAKGLTILESKAIIHADIKPQNIMLVDLSEKPFQVKFIGFARAMPYATAEQGIKTGTPGYMSPEMMLGLPLTQATDVWSLGCVLCNALKSILKIAEPPSNDLLDKSIITDLFNRHVREDRDKCVALLKKMLQFNPEDRITPEEILQHPFITDKSQRRFMPFWRSNKVGPTKEDPRPVNQLSRHESNYQTFTKHDAKAKPVSRQIKKQQELERLKRVKEKVKHEKCMRKAFGEVKKYSGRKLMVRSQPIKRTTKKKKLVRRLHLRPTSFLSMTNKVR